MSGLLTFLAFSLTAIFITELVSIALVKEDGGGLKLRPRKWLTESNLEPYEKVIVVGFAVLLVYLVVTFLLENVFYAEMMGFFDSMSLISLAIYDAVLALLVLGHLTYYHFGKEVDDIAEVLALVIIGLMAVLLEMEFSFFSNFL